MNSDVMLEAKFLAGWVGGRTVSTAVDLSFVTRQVLSLVICTGKSCVV